MTGNAPPSGKKLAARYIHVGTADDYFLDGAVHLAEGIPHADEETRPYEGVVEYGHGHGHCWNEQDRHAQRDLGVCATTRMFLPKIVERIRKTAPPGADLTSWVY